MKTLEQKNKELCSHCFEWTTNWSSDFNLTSIRYCEDCVSNRELELAALSNAIVFETVEVQ